MKLNLFKWKSKLENTEKDDFPKNEFPSWNDPLGLFDFSVVVNRLLRNFEKRIIELESKTAYEIEELCPHLVPKSFECSACIGCQCKCHIAPSNSLKMNAYFVGNCGFCNNSHKQV